jgi:2,4-dienoyl-CoA reductase-like NADH-dependent reductase (Old Yellow Enzyme family)/thioredoxin reductase
MQFEHLFTPIKIGSKTAKNRIVFPAHGIMGDYFTSGKENVAYLAYQLARARGGCGLNIIGPITIHKSSMRLSAPPFAPPSPEPLISKLSAMADALHEQGALVLLQFLLYGNSYNSAPGNATWGFSAQAAFQESQEVCHEMDESEINEVLDSYVKYIGFARQSGLDGVEIHACHGDLVQQSWSPWANHRKDKWGNPMAFSTELINRLRAAAGKDFILGFRITGDDFLPGGMDIEANKKIAQALEATGKLDLLNVSFAHGGGSYAYPIGTMYVPPASISVPLASGIKQAVKSLPVVACGRINEPTLAENAIADGHCDMVGVVRGQIADPEFANKAREGRVEDIRLCIACNQGCWDAGNGLVNCTQNAMAGKESTEYGSLKPALKKKKVLVIGGGPGGMEAARVAALRGHDVTLYEKEQQLGGQINTLVKAPGRDEFGQVTRYLVTQLSKLGVKVRLGTEADLDTIRQEKADAVIVATGSRPYINAIPGSEQSNVVNPSQVLNAEVKVGDNVIVYESTGLQEGPTVADYLAERGKKVEILTNYPNFAAWWGMPMMGIGTHIPILWPRLKRNGVSVTPFSRVVKISGQSVTVADVWSGEERVINNVDTVVMATGYRANDELYRALKGKVAELYAVGDCYSPKRALDAIHDAFIKSSKL